jgi:hypothetical protein
MLAVVAMQERQFVSKFGLLNVALHVREYTVLAVSVSSVAAVFAQLCLRHYCYTHSDSCSSW